MYGQSSTDVVKSLFGPVPVLALSLQSLLPLNIAILALQGTVSPTLMVVTAIPALSQQRLSSLLPFNTAILALQGTITLALMV